MLEFGFTSSNVTIEEEEAGEAQQAAVNVPSVTPPVCTDYIGWDGGAGAGCDWYEGNDDPGCLNKGHLYPNADGIDANFA